MTGTKVLVVDDEPTVREVVVGYLRRDGHEVLEAADGSTALALLDSEPPDLIVLDMMLPGVNGLDILRRVRSTSSIPVIMLTARAEESDRVAGLELGADDYVVKPFSPRELAARVNGVLRRTNGRSVASPQPIEYDGLFIDPLSREVKLGGKIIDMTPKEFDVLAFLAGSPRQVFSRAQLLEHVWQSSPDWQDPATVTVHVRRIRNKIEADPEKPRWITTVWGVGYRFET
ncbi:MAG: response regulator transcription factor [Ilumatobacter sp.]|jgi:DNA-binding response OmpR family regulator|uniref:response regulator transcription factor n=1 Tax=Ilumatobacter sp. TaxID=1967498 RepID=UPI00391B8BA6